MAITSFPVCHYLAACFANESFGLKSCVKKQKTLQKHSTEVSITFLEEKKAIIETHVSDIWRSIFESERLSIIKYNNTVSKVKFADQCTAFNFSGSKLIEFTADLTNIIHLNY